MVWRTLKIQYFFTNDCPNNDLQSGNLYEFGMFCSVSRFDALSSSYWQKGNHDGQWSKARKIGMAPPASIYRFDMIWWVSICLVPTVSNIPNSRDWLQLVVGYWLPSIHPSRIVTHVGSQATGFVVTATFTSEHEEMNKLWVKYQ